MGKRWARGLWREDVRGRTRSWMAERAGGGVEEGRAINQTSGGVGQGAHKERASGRGVLGIVSVCQKKEEYIM
jgi:hypothetical protein